MRPVLGGLRTVELTHLNVNLWVPPETHVPIENFPEICILKLKCLEDGGLLPHAFIRAGDKAVVWN